MRPAFPRPAGMGKTCQGGTPCYNKNRFINYIYFARGMDMESLVLSPQDVENLEAMSDGSTGYFYKMLDYLGSGWRTACAGGASPRRQKGRLGQPSGTPTPATTWTNMSRNAGRRSGWPRRRGARRPPAAAWLPLLTFFFVLRAAWRGLAYAEREWQWADYVWGAGYNWASCAATLVTRPGPWPQWSGGWPWSRGTMSSPPWPGRSGRAGAWRRWSTTGSTRSRTGGSRPERRRRGRWRTNAWPSPVSSATGPIWRPSRRPWA